MNKLVSIVMTVYNAQEFLSESIQSILDQTITDFEFIIIDDCSTDNSLNIAMEYQKKDSRIELHHHEKNMGIACARNTGIKLAHGKYIAWMDADDISKAQRIETELSFLEKNPQIGVVSSNANLIDRKGNLVDTVKMPQTNILIKWAFCFFDPIINPSVMINREIYSKAGEYRNLSEKKDDYFPEDYDLWIRIINLTQFHILNEPLISLRKHEQNITKTHLSSTITNSIRICGWYLQSLNSPKIKASDAELLWNPVTDVNVLQTFIVLKNLYHYFVSKEGINDQEEYYIQNDFICRINTLINYSTFGFKKIIIYVYKRIYQIQFLLSKIFRKIFSK
jgi:glycosyltransferase involved in cell wall biosynthesis